ncbi:4'-phosphopantetheinyl transferase family protein [Hwangdonia sp.]|uniref:4'-phosphopantetheinyl transferase family protein n=1 Tax=Hwangdonia sp. TaxID=1883432 RepID=UPI003AB3DB16
MSSPTKHFVNLKPNIIHTWLVNFDDKDEDAINKYYYLLSEDEKKRASKYKFHKDKRCYIITKGALRLLSERYLNIDARAITFDYGKYGKPDFSFNTNLKFNISHSGDILALSFVKEFDIGVDIEKIKDNFDVFEIASNFFSTLEIETLKKVPKEKQVEYFYRCWTRKESFIKAKAKGLSFPLDSFSVCINSDKKTELLETKWDAAEKHQWKLFTFSHQPDYLGAISIKGDIKTVEYFSFNND